MINLKNKNVLITGATGGIGNSLVEKFYSLESNIIATGTNEEKLNALKKKFPKILIEKFKLDDHEKIEKFIEENCLINQSFIKDPDVKIGQLIQEAISKLGENITINRFVRFALGEKS